jgi:hypothetical protein
MNDLTKPQVWQPDWQHGEMDTVEREFGGYVALDDFDRLANAYDELVTSLRELIIKDEVAKR